MTTVHKRSGSSNVAMLAPSTSPASKSSLTYTSVPEEDIELENVEERTDPLIRTDKRPAEETLQFWTGHQNPVRQRGKWHLLQRRLISRVLISTLVLGLLTILILMVVTPKMFTNERPIACKPDGSFALTFTSQSYSPWRRNSVFAIDIKFGNLSFGQAKFVDVLWDVVVGRGFQLLLATCAYHVFSQALTCIMETTAVPYETFKAITLQDDTLQGVISLSRSLSRNKTHRARGTISWMVIASTFILLTPTWLSAMTGYVTAALSFVADKNGNLVPLRQFQPLIYTIHNGAILENGQDDMKIAVPWKANAINSGEPRPIDSEAEMLDSNNVYGCASISAWVNPGTGDMEATHGDRTDPLCLWFRSVALYAQQYGFLATSNSSNTTFYQPSYSGLLAKPIDLPHPLNISANFALENEDMLSLFESNPYHRSFAYGLVWVNPKDSQRPFFKDNALFLEPSSETIYSLDELNENASCQQTIGLATYQWGFSYVLLYTFVLSLFIWVVGMWILHCDSLLRSRLLDRKMGYERAIIDISESVAKAVCEMENIDLQSNKELQILLCDSVLTYKTIPFDSSRSARLNRLKHTFSLKYWVKAERWWLVVLLVFSLLFVLSWTTRLFIGWSPLVAILPIAGVLLVLLVGREVHGRWTLFVFFLVVFLNFNVWWIVLMRDEGHVLDWTQGHHRWPLS